jgi:hypothetical protein
MMTSIPTVVEGETISLIEKFVDEVDDPIYPAEAYTGPEVFVFDNDDQRSVISQAVAAPGVEFGSWQADFSIPILNLEDNIILSVQWTLIDEEHQTHTLKTFIQVEPAVDNRIGDIVFIKPNKGIGKVEALLPISFKPDEGDTLFISAYKNNEPVFEGVDALDPSSGIKYRASSTMTNIQLRDTFGAQKLAPYVLMFEHRRQGSLMPKILSHNLWCVKPQVIVAMNMVEDYINKARLENVIPALQYTPGDLVQYLFRGLNFFNTLPPITTGFTGMNMQGHILDAWVFCACYFALASQLQAEGALAFDFSGQTVNLNVDRTPTIEAALGRVEQHIEQQIKPYKKMLAKAGMVQGDGSMGANHLPYGEAFGIVTVLNSPTTNHRYGGGPGVSLNGWTGSPRRGTR